MRNFMEKGNPRGLVALDLDRSDNISEEMIYRFISRFGQQLRGLILSGIPHITDQIWTSIMPVLSRTK